MRGQEVHHHADEHLGHNFLLDNKIHVNLNGTERTLNLDLDWDMSKLPDIDLSFPESGHCKMNAIATTSGGKTTPSTEIYPFPL